MELDELIITHRILLKLAVAFGITSPEAANLIESRRLVEGQMRSMGWEDE